MKGRMKTSPGNNAVRQKKGPASSLLILCILGLGGIGNTRVMACSPANSWQNKQQTVSFGDVIIQRDTAIGTVIASKVADVSNLPLELISDGYCRGSIFSISYTNGWSPLNGIAATNVAGIGVRLSFRQTPPLTGYVYIANQSKTNAAEMWSLAPTVWLIELIKTGPTSSGHLATGTWASASITPVVEAPWITTSLAVTGTNNITSVACSLNSTSINVPFGDVLDIKFTAIGTTVGDKSFDVGLTCDKNAKINVALAGTQNTDTTDTSVLALANAGQTGTAKGVGVQLLYGGTPLKINNNILLKTSPGGQETLPFTARYYQTNKLVTAGKANSSATLNITYQ